MRNEQYIDMNDMYFNIYLEHAVEVLETYEKYPKAQFEIYFAKAKIQKKHIRIHLELMRRMKRAIENQIDDIDDEEYIMVHKDELKRLKGE